MDTNKVPKIEISNARDFITNLPKAVKQEWLVGIETNFHFNIEGNSGGEFSVMVSEEKMVVLEGLHGEPKCVVATKEEHFIRLLKGDLHPMMAVFSGKLKVSNPAEIMKYAKLFGIG